MSGTRFVNGPLTIGGIVGALNRRALNKPSESVPVTTSARRALDAAGSMLLKIDRLDGLQESLESQKPTRATNAIPGSRNFFPSTRNDWMGPVSWVSKRRDENPCWGSLCKRAVHKFCRGPPIKIKFVPHDKHIREES